MLKTELNDAKGFSAPSGDTGLPTGGSGRYLRSFTPFLPATVFFGPLRVLALVRVR
jgi:hypothetical protein